MAYRPSSFCFLVKHMNTLLTSLGLSPDEFWNLVVLAAVALVALGILRVMLRLTATLVRLGCVVVVIGLVLAFVFSVFN